MSKPLTILYVNHVGLRGGAERSLADLMLGLDRSRFTPLLALPETGPQTHALGDIPTFAVPQRRLHRTHNLLRLAQYALGFVRAGITLGRLVRQHNVALLHANSTTAQFPVRFASAMTGMPAVWHCRDLAPLPPMARRLAAGRTHVIAISNAVESHLHTDGLKDAHITRIYNGIDAAALQGNAGQFRNELRLSDDDLLYGMTGQLVPWKRHDLFLAAAQRIAAEQPKARFVVVGADLFNDHPQYLASLQETVSRLGLSERVFFCGFKDRIADVLLDLNVLIHPAEKEPFGRVVAEAMALARPVVAVNAGGPAELIQHEESGLLVPPGSASAIADAALRLTRDSSFAASLGRAAQRRIETDFSLPAFLRRMEQFYMEIAARN